jgi:hypothetical protein
MSTVARTAPALVALVAWIAMNGTSGAQAGPLPRSARVNDAESAPSTVDRDAIGAAHALLPASEWAAIRQVIADQLAALRRGDAVGAFSFAAPGIRERFGDAPTFLAMVRESYAALLDARYTEYLDGAVVDDTTIQPLRLDMDDDTVLVALYQMRKGDDGRWRVSGCVIAPSTLRST